MKNKISWLRTIVYLILFLMIGSLSPSEPIDRWGLFSPKKVVYLIFVLALVQALGATLIRLLGARAGTIASGFFGGLISSTAMTALLSRKSNKSHSRQAISESLAYLSASLAMLIEALVITCFGSDDFDPQLLIIFSGPLVLTTVMIVLRSRKPHEEVLDFEESIQLNIWSLVKLSIFIVGILALSKILENLFGQSGILVLTFLVSLFEIHGSFIANVQLHDAQVVDIRLLGGLMAVAISASYVSKLFLVVTLGGRVLKDQVLKWTGLIFLSLIASWVVFQLLV